ncbi:MAG TPA: Fumble domain-containing protein [Candidatus Binatia bacterium]
MHSAAIDFGGTVTDLVLRRPGRDDVLLALPSASPEPAVAEELLAQLVRASVDGTRSALELVAVTGGRSWQLPDRLGSTRVVKVDEPTATAVGGLREAPPTPAIVVSLGTGTGIVLADPPNPPQRLVGSGIGGGTLLGLAKLLLGTTDVETIGELSRRGDVSRCDLTVGDILGSGVGPVPAEATAAHFARVARKGGGEPRPEDLAAALINLVGQAALRLAFEAARFHSARSIVLLGHVLDVPGFRDAIERIPLLDRSFVRIVTDPGFAVARGALETALRDGAPYPA